MHTNRVFSVLRCSSSKGCFSLKTIGSFFCQFPLGIVWTQLEDVTTTPSERLYKPSAHSPAVKISEKYWYQYLSWRARDFNCDLNSTRRQHWTEGRLFQMYAATGLRDGSLQFSECDVCSAVYSAPACRDDDPMCSHLLNQCHSWSRSRWQ